MISMPLGIFEIGGVATRHCPFAIGGASSGLGNSSVSTLVETPGHSINWAGVPPNRL